MKKSCFGLLITLVLLSFAAIATRPSAVSAETFHANGLETLPNKGQLGGVPDTGDPDIGQGGPKTAPKLGMSFNAGGRARSMTVWIRWTRVVWTTRIFQRGF